VTVRPESPPVPGGPVPSDGDLVRRVLAGEGQAFGALYERHGPRVERFLAFRTRDQDLVADLAQDVFLRALRGLAGLRERERFGAWVLTIAQRAVADHWAAAERHREERVQASAPTAGWAEVPDIGWLDVAQAAARLSDDHQAVLALRFAAGLSLEDTARALDRSPDAVKQLQRRALARLRRALLPQAEGDEDP
jgi:RNA polymerase sigma-70 factor (ECF subfamily)